MLFMNRTRYIVAKEMPSVYVVYSLTKYKGEKIKSYVATCSDLAEAKTLIRGVKEMFKMSCFTPFDKNS